MNNMLKYINSFSASYSNINLSSILTLRAFNSIIHEVVNLLWIMIRKKREIGKCK